MSKTNSVLKKHTHTDTTADQRWLSIEDFTIRFGFSRATQQRLRAAGKLPYSKIGNIIRYDSLLIDEFFSEHLVTA